jgi:hypothetical protein
VAAAMTSTLLCTGAPFGGGPSVASAATPPGPAALTTQALQLQSQIVGDATALHDTAVAVVQARQRLSTTGAALTGAEATLAALQAKLAAAAATLRAIALEQYMQDTDTAQLTSFWGSPDVVSTTATYLQLATTSESTAVAAYSEAAGAVERQATALVAARNAAAAAYSAVTSRYGALQAAARILQAQLAKVQAQQAALAAEGPPSGVPLSNLVSPNSSFAEDLYRLRVCESGDNYQEDTGNGYYGAYQFSEATWQGLGYSGLPNQAPPAQQDAAATTLQHEHGWGEWPACSAMLGLH